MRLRNRLKVRNSGVIGHGVFHIDYCVIHHLSLGFVPPRQTSGILIAKQLVDQFEAMYDALRFEYILRNPHPPLRTGNAIRSQAAFDNLHPMIFLTVSFKLSSKNRVHSAEIEGGMARIK